MSPFFRRLLRSLGFKVASPSRRKTSLPSSPYTYERDEKGRLIRHGAKGAERLSYESWHPVDAPQQKGPRKR